MPCFFLVLALALTGWLSSSAQAHDTWVQPHAPLVRQGDVAALDLMLGNHGNDHRDFKLAGKLDLTHATLHMIDPTGQRHDLKADLTDQGLTPREGYWACLWPTRQPGLHMVAHTDDRVVHYAPLRSVKSAKAYFVVSHKLDKVSKKQAGYDRVLGHMLELVPLSDPITRMKPGRTWRFQLLYQGKPLTDHRVSFIPRGVTLQAPIDERYERLTDHQGHVVFTPDQANLWLIVAHHRDDTLKGDKHQATKFSATVMLHLPAIPLHGR